MTKKNEMVDFGFSSLNLKYVGCNIYMKIVDAKASLISYDEINYDAFIDKDNKIYVLVTDKVKDKEKIVSKYKTFIFNNCYNFKNVRTYEFGLHSTLPYINKISLNTLYNNNKYLGGKKTNLTNSKIYYISNFLAIDELGGGSTVPKDISDAVLTKLAELINRLNNPFKNLSIVFNKTLLTKLTETKKIDSVATTITEDIYALFNTYVYPKQILYYKDLNIKTGDVYTKNKVDDTKDTIKAVLVNMLSIHNKS